MPALAFSVQMPGMLTTVQDSGRRSYQGKGMPMAGAMDMQSFALGNILVGNDENAAALEVTLLGPTLSVTEGEGVVAVTGAELGFTVNGVPVANWTAVTIREGDTLSFAGPRAGCRAYLCVSGGIDVPIVMESRSTYTRAKVGGLEGRALKKGDTLRCGEPAPLWNQYEGFVCPEEFRPLRDPAAPLRVVPGPQDDLFTEKGLATFYGTEYVISNSADRMGYRMDGEPIEHAGAADIISDAIPLGAVQAPGHGQPIVMLADRQTTGGYTKIGVVCSVDVAALSQRLPGAKVRFMKISLKDAVELVRGDAKAREALRALCAAWRSGTRAASVPGLLMQTASPCGEAIMRVDGEEHVISWEEIGEVE